MKGDGWAVKRYMCPRRKSYFTNRKTKMESMSLKFKKDREVSIGYAKCPMYYTGIRHPNNKDKELVIMDFIGKKVTACWRNMKLNKTGIEFLLSVTQAEDGIIFKDKIYFFKNFNIVW